MSTNHVEDAYWISKWFYLLPLPKWRNLPTKEKRARRGSLGTKDQLLLTDKMLLRSCKRQSWILYYREAFNMKTHPWNLKRTELFGIASNIRALLNSSIPQWNVKLYINDLCCVEFFKVLAIVCLNNCSWCLWYNLQCC